MKIHHLLLTILLLLLTGLPAHADGPVWKISKGDSTLLIGGTIHVLGPADYPLPPAFDQAYAQASELVLETDLDQVQSREFQQRMFKGMLLPAGRTMRQVLQPATYQAVAAFAASRKIPMDGLQTFKPALLTLTLTALELQRLGLAGTGVDQFYQQRAKTDHKPLGELESVDQQLAFLRDMGAGREDAMVNQTLEDLAQLPEMIGSLKTAWRRGDTEAMAEIALAPWQKKFPAVYQQLLVKRNRAWLPQIEALLKTPPVELVLVGALHLVGDDGILRQLAARGYRVEPL